MAAKELVDDMKLMAEIHPEGTYHPTFEPEYIGGIWSQKRSQIRPSSRSHGEGDPSTQLSARNFPAQGYLTDLLKTSPEQKL